MKEKLQIVKIGGNVIDDSYSLNLFLKDFASIPGKKILVHGGGKLATELAGKLGVSQVLWQGRRITDEKTLKIAVMVYAGWINKQITASLNAFGGTAIGICGADLKILTAVKRQHPEIDFGFVGDIETKDVNVAGLQSLLQLGTPVFAPVTADASGQLLNTNADTIASVLASALASCYEVQLNYCFEKKGVLRDTDDEESWVRKLNLTEFRLMLQNAQVSKGMLPKLENSFLARQNGVSGVYIGHFSNIHHMIACHENAGTYIV